MGFWGARFKENFNQLKQEFCQVQSLVFGRFIGNKRCWSETDEDGGAESGAGIRSLEKFGELPEARTDCAWF